MDTNSGNPWNTSTCFIYEQLFCSRLPQTILYSDLDSTYSYNLWCSGSVFYGPSRQLNIPCSLWVVNINKDLRCRCRNHLHMGRHQLTGADPGQWVLVSRAGRRSFLFHVGAPLSPASVPGQRFPISQISADWAELIAIRYVFPDTDARTPTSNLYGNTCVSNAFCLSEDVCKTMCIYFHTHRFGQKNRSGYLWYYTFICGACHRNP